MYFPFALIGVFIFHLEFALWMNPRRLAISLLNFYRSGLVQILSIALGIFAMLPHAGPTLVRILEFLGLLQGGKRPWIRRHDEFHTVAFHQFADHFTALMIHGAQWS